MTAKLSRKIKDMLLDGLADPSPVEKAFNVHFIRFDSFTVNNKEVSFKYRGEPVFSMPHEADLTSDTLTITGVEGKMPISTSKV